MVVTAGGAMVVFGTVVFGTAGTVVFFGTVDVVVVDDVVVV